RIRHPPRTRRRDPSRAVLPARPRCGRRGQPMKAQLCREYGPPESLVYEEVPDPTPGPGEVVVGVRAAAVNFPDVLFLSGGYQVRIPPPFSPGSEFAGEILAVGPEVDWRPGERVS